MQARRRFKQTTSLQDRLSEFVSGERAKAKGMPESDDRTSQEGPAGRGGCEYREMGELAQITAAEVIGT